MAAKRNQSGYILRYDKIASASAIPVNRPTVSSKLTSVQCALQDEIALLSEILAHVDQELGLREEQDVQLSHVLRAYEAVLRTKPAQPADDQFFYRHAFLRLLSVAFRHFA